MPFRLCVPLVDPVADHGISVGQPPGLLESREPVVGNLGRTKCPHRISTAGYFPHTDHVSDQQVAVRKRRDAPGRVGRERPQLVAVEVVLHHFVKLRVGDDHGSIRGEPDVTELPVRSDRMPSGKNDFPLRDTGDDVHHARYGGIAVDDKQHVFASGSHHCSSGSRDRIPQRGNTRRRDPWHRSLNRNYDYIYTYGVDDPMRRPLERKRSGRQGPHLSHLGQLNPGRAGGALLQGNRLA